MGQERECTLRVARRTIAGKALLEGDHLLFRGPERIKFYFKDLMHVEAREGILKLETASGQAQLVLGTAAQKWADKILHPPSRIAKLGVKPGTAVQLCGRFEDAFARELRDAGAVIAAGRTVPDLLLFPARRAADLEHIPRLAAVLKPAGALWVVYPKGIMAIREVEVIEAGRNAGLKDVKVAAFSPAETALKFVVPRER